MPVVPTSTVPSVSPTPNTGVPYQTAAGASPDAFGASIGEAEKGLGAGFQQLGNTLEKHALKMQEDVNASTAKDLFLQGDVEIGKLQVQYNSLEGANRVNAYPKYVEDIGAVREKYKQLAPNIDVARRFDQDFARRVGYSIVDGARSAASANKQYQKDTNAAVQTNAMGHIAANAQDDKRFETELGIGLDTVRSSDDYKGASPETQKAHEDAFKAQAWSTRLQAMSRDNPVRARDLLKNADIDGATRIKLEPIINQAIIQRDTKVSSDNIISAVGTGAMEERVKKLEGYSEKPYADFKQVSSGYGTRAQPGDENIPPDQRQAVYTQRLRNELSSAYQIVDNFAPGLPKGARDALADLTYNAGSQWTQSGLGQAVRAGDLEKAKSILPQYNQAGGQVNAALVARRAEEVSWWNADKGPSTDSTGILAKAMDKAKERAVEVFPNDPYNQAAYLDTLQQRITADLCKRRRGTFNFTPAT
jgi:GH24 family phage-related lysozyme (muramidase)